MKVKTRVMVHYLGERYRGTITEKMGGLYKILLDKGTILPRVPLEKNKEAKAPWWIIGEIKPKRRR